MHINIDSLKEDELRELNHRIVERLRILRDVKAHMAMMDFRRGERVQFHPEGRETVIGTLTKYNRKSVTVIADNGVQWTVAPSFLRKVTGGDSVRASTKFEQTQLSLIKG